MGTISKQKVDSIISLKALTGIIIGQVIETDNYYSDYEGGGRLYKCVSLTAGGFTDDGGSTFIGEDGRVYQPFDNNYIHVDQWGCKGDDSTDNSVQLLKVFNYGHSTQNDINIGIGIYLTDTRNLVFNLLEDERFSIIGESKYSSVIKNLDNAIEADNERMIYFLLEKINIDNIIIKNLTLDGNARGSTPPTGESDYEHSHLVMVAGLGSGSYINNIEYDNVVIKDPHADGFSFSQGNSTNDDCIRHLAITNCIGIDRTGVRSDIQISDGVGYMLVDNFKGFNIESELLSDPDIRVEYVITNSIFDDLDMSGVFENHNTIVKCFNVTTNKITSINNVTFIADNCKLMYGNSQPSWLALGIESRISNSKIFIESDGAGDSGGINTGVNTNLIHSGITFNDVDFISTDDAATITGELIRGSTAIATSRTKTFFRKFINCRFDSRVERIINADRNGEWFFNDCEHPSSVGGEFMFIGNTTGFYSDVTITNGKYDKCLGDFVVFGTFIEETFLRLRGDVYNENALSFNLSTGGTVTLDNIISNRIFYLDVNPILAAKGDVFILDGFDNKKCIAWTKITSDFEKLLEQSAIHSDSSAGDVATMVSDFNSLLAKLRTANILKT